MRGGIAGVLRGAVSTAAAYGDARGRGARARGLVRVERLAVQRRLLLHDERRPTGPRCVSKPCPPEYSQYP